MDHSLTVEFYTQISKDDLKKISDVYLSVVIGHSCIYFHLRVEIQVMVMSFSLSIKLANLRSSEKKKMNKIKQNF